MSISISPIISIILGISLFTHPTIVLASESKPNIVILYADDMGSGDLTSFNKNSKIPTPNLDQLAAQGMSFTDAHSSSGICSPSRYALLTGRYHWRKFHQIVKAFGPSVFADERLTLPEMLQQKGYTTAAIGKWHLGWNWPNKVPANSKTDELVSQIDIMATIASIVGFTLPDDAAEDSYDLLPLWSGKTKNSGRDSLIHNTFEDAYAIRSGDWNLIAAKTGNQNRRMARFNYND